MTYLSYNFYFLYTFLFIIKILLKLFIIKIICYMTSLSSVI